MVAAKEAEVECATITPIASYEAKTEPPLLATAVRTAVVSPGVVMTR